MLDVASRISIASVLTTVRDHRYPLPCFIARPAPTQHGAKATLSSTLQISLSLSLSARVEALAAPRSQRYLPSFYLAY